MQAYVVACLVAAVVLTVLTIRGAGLPLHGQTMQLAFWCGGFIGLPPILFLASPWFSQGLMMTWLAGSSLAVFFWLRQATWMNRQLEALDDPRRRDAALANIRARIDELLSKEDGATRSAAELVTASAALIEIGQPVEAISLLEMVPVQDLDGATAVLVANNKAVAHVDVGERRQARRTLELVDEDAGDSTARAVLCSTSALVTALDGNFQEALSQIEALPASRPAGVEGALDIARAHALVGLGEMDDAEAILERLAATQDGWRTLDRIARHDGPASGMALELAKRHLGPYR